MTLQVDDRSNPVLIAALLVLRPKARPLAVSLGNLNQVVIRRSREDHDLDAFHEPTSATTEFPRASSLALAVHDPSAPWKSPLALTRASGGWRVEPTTGAPSNRPMIGSRDSGWRPIDAPHALRDMDVIQTGAAFFVFRDIRGPNGKPVDADALMRFCTGTGGDLGSAFPELPAPEPSDLSERAGERSLIAREVLLGRWPSLDDVTRYVRGRLRLSTPPDRPAEGETEERILGREGSLAGVMAVVKQVARSPSPVLIQGETGTGKEMIARVLHERSKRAGRYLQLNCAALPENLVEAMLFGAVEGIYTNAKNLAGFFEEAHGGTLLLDEIGELSLPAQAKLLRAIEQGEVVRLGATRPTKVDVRVLAATHVDLDRAVAAGTFRRDLLHRIRVVAIHVPRLADRKEDLRPLFLSALKAAAAVNGVSSLPTMADADWATLEAHSWPGNVRELQNVATRLVLTGALTIDGALPEDDVSMVWDDIVAEAGRRSARGRVKEYPQLLRSLAATPPMLRRVPEGLRKYVEARSREVLGVERRVNVADLIDLLARSPR